MMTVATVTVTVRAAEAVVPAAVILASALVWLRRVSLPGFDTELPEGFGQPLRIARYLLGDPQPVSVYARLGLSLRPKPGRSGANTLRVSR